MESFLTQYEMYERCNEPLPNIVVITELDKDVPAVIFCRGNAVSMSKQSVSKIEESCQPIITSRPNMTNIHVTPGLVALYIYTYLTG